jgi:hypothetical protein
MNEVGLDPTRHQWRAPELCGRADHRRDWGQPHGLDWHVPSRGEWAGLRAA